MKVATKNVLWTLFMLDKLKGTENWLIELKTPWIQQDHCLDMKSEYNSGVIEWGLKSFTKLFYQYKHSVHLTIIMQRLSLVSKASGFVVTLWNVTHVRSKILLFMILPKYHLHYIFYIVFKVHYQHSSRARYLNQRLNAANFISV